MSENIIHICALVAAHTPLDFWTIATTCFESPHFHATIDYIKFFTRALAEDDGNADAKFYLFSRVLEYNICRATDTQKGELWEDHIADLKKQIYALFSAAVTA
ncbi:hypothetical protein T492DRAFT_843102 [Pavlovales sp. CCMP2436]|nr:hypothetical protein T492DRAFT_843102 [Pavlovales sp. CCMP2436]